MQADEPATLAGRTSVRLRFPLVLLAVVAVSAGIGWLLGRGGPPRPAQATTVRHAAAVLPRLPRGWSYIAVAKHRKLAVYSSPRLSRPWKVLSNRLTAGEPLSLRVHHSRLPWLQVFLPTRPNGATAWVRARSVKVLSTSWAVIVQLRSHRLIVARSDLTVRVFTIGVGQSVTPTPAGTYYITELLKQPDPYGLYGPFAFGLSAFSGVLQHFGEGGNGQIGIHGTDQPELVGQNVSHGCIRLRNPDVVWLTKRLPLGTPVRIERD